MCVCVGGGGVNDVYTHRHTQCTSLESIMTGHNDIATIFSGISLPAIANFSTKYFIPTKVYTDDVYIHRHIQCTSLESIMTVGIMTLQQYFLEAVYQILQT